jgi:5,5'-dehydrodivanillate O-demethylase
LAPEDEDPEVIYVKPFKDPPDALHPFTRFTLDAVLAQDHMAWETQGPIVDRSKERLATSDRGIVLYRDILKREIDKIREGGDPLAVVRDPNHAVIDTFLTESLAEGWFDPARRDMGQPAAREAVATA